MIFYWFCFYFDLEGSGRQLSGACSALLRAAPRCSALLRAAPRCSREGPSSQIPGGLQKALNSKGNLATRLETIEIP